MSKIKLSIIFSFFIIFNINVLGQNDINIEITRLKKQTSIPKLSKAQMYADFDTLVSIIKRCNPQYLVRKKITGYDMISEMSEKRNLIEECKNSKQFIELLRKTLFLALDEHCGLGSNVWHYRYNIYANDVKINNITDKEFGINFHYRDEIFYNWPPEINFIYTQDKYFLKNKTVFYNKSDSLVLSLGTEIVSFNNQLINEYLSAIRTIGSQWDFKNHKYYNSTLYVKNPKNRIGFYKDNNYNEFRFTNFLQEEIKWNASSEEFRLHWFDKDSVLYFRIPKMSLIDIPALLKFKEIVPEFEIPEWKLHFEENVLSFASKPIKSIIIDIRGNEGGNDAAWKYFLMGLILKKPITYPFYLITCDDKDVFLRYPPEADKKVAFDFIDFNYQFCVFEEEIDTLRPSSNNLGFEGKIYLLVDKDCYSSALGFASLNSKTEKIKTVGMPTGKIGGQGVAASAFILPHSKLIFTLHLFLDASCVSKAEDFYHDQVSYPVLPSLEYYKYWYNPNRSYTIDEQAMYKYDEVFLKALEVVKAVK